MEFFIVSTVILLIIVVYQFIVNKKQYEELSKIKADQACFKGTLPITNGGIATTKQTPAVASKKSNNNLRGRKPKTTSTK